MHRIPVNQVQAQIFVDLLQRRKKKAPHYLAVVTYRETRQSVSLIPRVASENGRYVQLEIDTNQDDPTNGGILVERAQDADIKVYASQSAIELDPTSPDVVALLLTAGLQFTGEPTADTIYQNPNEQTPIIYG